MRGKVKGGAVIKACASCQFWRAEGGLLRGLCHRLPPTPMAGGQAWPRTNVDDWCGEHREVARG